MKPTFQNSSRTTLPRATRRVHRPYNQSTTASCEAPLQSAGAGNGESLHQPVGFRLPSRRRLREGSPCACP